jgi:TRAP-type mannitol/chloroaromatic compound transport system permease small subunit
MPRAIKAYVRYVDALNRSVGAVVMYLIFVMMGVLLVASISRYFFNTPFVWVVEFSQFMMAAYYTLGGGFSMQIGSHVRMDVLYERWKPRTQGFWDSITAIFMVFYLIVLLRGGIMSTHYSYDTGQTNYSAWAPLMWPIKAIMATGIVLMLLQAIAMFFRDLAKFTGRDIA